MKIRKGDKVRVVKGKDRGQMGTVERVLLKENKVIVSGVNIYKKHLKPRRKDQERGIVEITKPIAVGNVKIMCSKCQASTRVGYEFVKDKKVRVCKRCSAQIDG